MRYKKCTKCLETKSETEFYNRGGRMKHLLKSRCIKCLNSNPKTKEYKRKYKQKSVLQLSDSYIKDNLRINFKQKASELKNIDLLIQVKRLQIITTRICKTIKHQEN